MSDLLTVSEAAATLRHSVSSVRRLVRRGRLPAYRVGGRLLFKPKDLDAFVAAGRLAVVPRSLPSPPRRRRSSAVREDLIEIAAQVTA